MYGSKFKTEIVINLSWINLAAEKLALNNPANNLVFIYFKNSQQVF